MPVTDQQVAALRALLTDDVERHRQIYAQIDRAEARTGYTALVAGAFCEAVDRRFTGSNQTADVIRFVGDVRSRSERLTRELDPVVAERVLQSVLGDASVADLSDAAVAGAQLLLLAGLIADEHLDDTALDAFLADARKLADQLMS
jgi:hypothetical protein